MPSMIKASIAALAWLAASSAVHADSFTPAPFQTGDSWTYDIAASSIDGERRRYRTEYAILWTTKMGTWLTGQRGTGGNHAWTPGKDFRPDRCLVFVIDPGDDFGEGFCDAEITRGHRVKRERSLVSGFTTYLGSEDVSVPAGSFAAARFSIDERMKGQDSTAPLAVKRVWNYWYAPLARGFVKMRLEYFDLSGKVVRTVAVDLVELQLKPQAPVPASSPRE